MTDMNTGMPFYWYGANPVNVVPPNQALQNNLAQNTAANQALSQQTTAASAQTDANSRAFMDWSRGTNANMTRLTDEAIASNLAIGNRQPAGTYIGNRLAGSVFNTGTKPFNDYGGVGGSQIFDPGSYYTKNPDVWSSGADAWKHYNQYGQNEGRGGAWSSIFNEDVYKQKNPDVAAAGTDPTRHWFEYGQKEQRQGAQTFDPGKYLVQNPDVWKAGADPWRHWNMFGEKEGRKGSWTDAFNPDTYRQQNPDVAAAGVDPTAHWYQYGSKEGRKGDWGGQLSPLQSYQGTGFDAFDPNIYVGSHPTAGFGNQPSATATEQDWQDLWNTRGPYNRSPQSSVDENRSNLAADYYAANRDVYDAARASGRDPTEFGIEHLMAFGEDEDRTFFDRDEYLNTYKDVRDAGMDPTAHWYQFGSKEGRAAPMDHFNYGEYLTQNPDVLGSGMDPMAHWLQFGANEKRQGALSNLTNTLVDQRKGFAEQARKDPNLMFKLVAKALEEDQNSSEGRTSVIEAMLNRLNATGQSPLNPGYYPTDKQEYNAKLEAKLRADPALYASVLADVERAFGGSNLSKYATNWSSGQTWLDEKPYVNPTQAMGANQFYIKNLNTPAGKAWAGPRIVSQNQRWLDRMMGNTASGN